MALFRASTTGLVVGSLLFASGALVALAQDGMDVPPPPPTPPKMNTEGKSTPTNLPLKRPGVASSTPINGDKPMMPKGDLSTSTKIRMMEEMRKNGSSTPGHEGMAPCAATTEGTPSPCSQGKMGSTTMGRPPLDMLLKREMEMREKLLNATGSTTPRPPLKIRDEWKKQWKETSTSTKDRVKEKVMIDVKNVTKRLGDAIDNLKKIADRVQSRVDKLATAGADVTDATNSLGDAKGALSAATTDLQTVVTNLNTVINSENPRDDFAKVQDSVNKVKVDIKAGYDALRKAVDSLKKTDGEITTTPPQNNEGEDHGADGENPAE